MERDYKRSYMVGRQLARATKYIVKSSINIVGKKITQTIYESFYYSIYSYFYITFFYACVNVPSALSALMLATIQLTSIATLLLPVSSMGGCTVYHGTCTQLCTGTCNTIHFLPEYRYTNQTVMRSFGLYMYNSKL